MTSLNAGTSPFLLLNPQVISKNLGTQLVFYKSLLLVLTSSGKTPIKSESKNMQSNASWREAEWFVVSSHVYKMCRGVKNMDFRAVQNQVQILLLLLANYVMW